MIRCIAVIAGIFGLDTYSKHMVRKKLPLGSKKEVVKNYFFLRHIKNKGMAYNIGDQNPNMVLYVTTALTALCIYQFVSIWKKAKEYTAMLLPTSLMLGGAFGNLYDRWRNGSVTDFLYVPIKKAPIFNIADVALALGAIWACLLSIGKK